MFLNRSTKNTSELLRVSCDTRWQRADQPVDSRLVILTIWCLIITTNMAKRAKGTDQSVDSRFVILIIWCLMVTTNMAKRANQPVDPKASLVIFIIRCLITNMAKRARRAKEPIDPRFEIARVDQVERLVSIIVWWWSRRPTNPLIQGVRLRNHNHAKDLNLARLYQQYLLNFVYGTMIHSSYDIFLHDTFLLTRYVGEDFPWLGKAPKHGLWAEEVGIKTIMVIVDSIAAALF